MHHETGQAATQRRTQTKHRGQRAKAHIKTPGALGQVLDDHREQRAKDPRADAVEHLYRHQPVRITGQGVEHAAQWQDQETCEQQRFATPHIGLEPHQPGHRHHHQLRGDDARRGQRRSHLQVDLRKLLADQRQHRRIGQVEEGAADGEYQQRPVGQQDFHTGRLFVIAVVGRVKAPGDFMVNRLGRHTAHGHDTGQRHKGHQVKHHHRAVQVRQAAGQQRCHSIAGVVEGFVAPRSAGEGAWPGNSEGNGRYGRCKHRGGHGTGGLGQGHPTEGADKWQHQATDGHQDGSRRNHRALAACAVDQRARRALGDQCGDARQGHDHADAGRVPFVHGQQVNRQVRPEAVAHIGQEKIEAVQGQGITQVRVIGHGVVFAKGVQGLDTHWASDPWA